MKHLLLIIFALLSGSSWAEDSVYLDFALQESSVYAIEQENLQKMKMSFSGDKSRLPEDLRERLPMDLTIKQVVNQTIDTNSKQLDNTFAVAMTTNKKETFISFDGENWVKQPPQGVVLEGITIHGISNGGVSMQYQSYTGGNLDKETEGMLKSVFEQLSNSNMLSGRKIKIGETSNFNFPMSIPVGSIGAVNFEMEMVYLLQNLTGDQAHFDTTYNVLVPSALEDASIEITGGGTGVTTYDTQKRIAPLMTSDMTMDIVIPFEGGELKITSGGESNVRTSIKPRLTSNVSGRENENAPLR